MAMLTPVASAPIPRARTADAEGFDRGAMALTLGGSGRGWVGKSFHGRYAHNGRKKAAMGTSTPGTLQALTTP